MHFLFHMFTCQNSIHQMQSIASTQLSYLDLMLFSAAGLAFVRPSWNLSLRVLQSRNSRQKLWWIASTQLSTYLNHENNYFRQFPAALVSFPRHGGWICCAENFDSTVGTVSFFDFPVHSKFYICTGTTQQEAMLENWYWEVKTS